ncbi:FbpB family small basic protein [Alteribacillus sp. HJP-4]
MRKPKRSTLEELIKENKEELISDAIAMDELEKRLEERKSKEENDNISKSS